MVRYMTVNVEGKCGCSVTEIRLYRLYVIPCPDRGNGIAVSEIVKETGLAEEDVRQMKLLL